MTQAQDITVAIATEVAKQIPVKEVYQDALQPGVKQTGNLIEDIAKTLHLALAPIQLTAALQDRYRRFLDEAVRRVPLDRRINPPAQILGPVIEGIRYEPSGSSVEELFSGLLTNSMDAEKVRLAHPAFPQLIKQLSPDEAIMIKIMHLARMDGLTFKRTLIHRLSNDRFYFERVENEEFPISKLAFADNLNFYMEHLGSMGLAGLYRYQNQQPIFTGEYNAQVQTGSREFLEYRLTEMGAMLAEAAIPGQTPLG